MSHATLNEEYCLFSKCLVPQDYNHLTLSTFLYKNSTFLAHSLFMLTFDSGLNNAPYYRKNPIAAVRLIRRFRGQQKENTVNKILAPITLLAFISTVTAQPRKPPQEAFEACNSMSEGAACTIETPRGTLEGTCRIPPEEEQLVCVPAKVEGRRPRRDKEESPE